MSFHRKALADQSGFTMITVIITMSILGLFAVGAWGAANNDLPVGRQDADRKRAYEAAEAGLQWYTYQLQRDTNYWTYCGDNSKTPAYVQLKGTRAAWRPVGGADTDVDTATAKNLNAEFAIEQIPNGTTTTAACLADPSSKLLSNGVLRIRSTGRYNGKMRQVVGTFRRSGFLDYVWYTKWETQSPQVYDDSDISWASTNCGKGRKTRSGSCMDLQFPDRDAINGPMHTEDDSLLVCDSPDFGRDAGDKIEILGATTKANASVASGGCGNNPNWNGTVQLPAKSVDLPESNGALSSVADRTYQGTTCLQFNSGDTMSVYANLTCAGSPTSTVTLTGDTTIWVANKAACSGYDVAQQYTNSTNCGDVGVKGTYSKNITIGSADDIVVVGNLTHTGDGLMGLVANQFVRVYHPVNWSNGNCTTNALPSSQWVNFIDAAILATTGSFLADNAKCGAALNTLTIKGAIAQKWRGIIGQTNSNGTVNGYIKSYNYDDRLRYREPPNFLDPVTVTWNLLRESEQTPVG